MPSSPQDHERTPFRKKARSAVLRKIICANALIAILLAGTLVLYPAARAALNLRDPALKGPGVPQIEWRLMRHLTPRYAHWAQQQVAPSWAAGFSTRHIYGTEWAFLGSVYYLWAIDNLQSAWQAGDHSAGIEPGIYCKDAIVAASEHVIDPRQAAWIEKQHDTNRLAQDHLFYRMLVIAALTSRARLLHDGAHLDLLREQVETLCREMDRSKSGLLNNQPGKCHPADVMEAIACIHRADPLLATNHASFIARSLRGFIAPGSRRLSLPPYLADAKSGAALSKARGSGNSLICLTSPELWPAVARGWFELYEKDYWQVRLGWVGFREFPRGFPGSGWAMDADCGPILGGFGVAANAFGVGAARKNGRFDLAYPLSSEIMAASWELADGTLAVPRALSKAGAAPLLGEAAILWVLSVQPERGFPVEAGGSIPAFVYVIIIVAILFALWRIDAGIDLFVNTRRNPEPEVVAPGFQVLVWVALIAGAMTAMCLGLPLPGLALLLVALLFPRTKKPPPQEDAEEAK